MPDEWLIDGYNVLHSRKAAGHKRSGISLNWLLNRLAGFSSSAEHLVVLVLDGFGNEEELSSFRTKYFHIVYSKKKSADAYIESYLFENRSRARLTVVTNDRAIADLARGGGSRVLSVSDLMELLEETKGQNADILFDEKVRSHGFNCPFERKLKDKGFAG